MVEKSTDCEELSADRAKGERNVVTAYVSDAQGKYAGQGNYITLVLAVAPNLPIGSPIEYFRGETCRGNLWIDYKMLIINKNNGSVWNKEVNRIMPLIDKFNLKGTFTHEDIKLTYASYKPVTKNTKSPLIIWLHGGGEGGTDPTIPLLGNRAANYASDEIQFYFDGAYVLVPQCPTRWMDAGNGQSTSGVWMIFMLRHYLPYSKTLLKQPDIDRKRIYVGGCSNGGYMSFELIVKNPAYFAAGYISALAYGGEYFTDAQARSIKNVPIWFVHSADDQTTIPDQTVLPVYNKLKSIGAKNVHLSYYNNVVDITGFYGGEGYHYTGHWSWVYMHANNADMISTARR
jgi:predicted peptidase